MSDAFGDVILVPFPFTDQSTTKRRPAVVSSSSYNSQRPDLILLAITSQVHVPLSFGEALVADWQAARLIRPSVFKSLITTLEQAIVIKQLGTLSANDAATLRIEQVEVQIIGTNVDLAVKSRGGFTRPV